MYFSGAVRKVGRGWLIEVPALDLMTQASTKKGSYDMLTDALESLVNCKDFKVRIFPLLDDRFILGTNNDNLFIALVLKRQRIKHGLSLSDMAKRLGASSKNAYAQYEQGKNLPSLPKLQEFLQAMGKNVILTFNVIEKDLKEVA
jgi:DNA-binding XRE family transcriptional regulator